MLVLKIQRDPYFSRFQGQFLKMNHPILEKKKQGQFCFQKYPFFTMPIQGYFSKNTLHFAQKRGIPHSKTILICFQTWSVQHLLRPAYYLVWYN